MSELPGGDQITLTVRADTGGVDALAQALVSDVTFTVSGCVFESVMSGPREEQTDVTTSTEDAWVFLPYVAGSGIPVTDSGGAPTFLTTLDNTTRITPVRTDLLGQRAYKMLGQPEVQYDLDGQPDHVMIACQWRAG